MNGKSTSGEPIELLMYLCTFLEIFGGSLTFYNIVPGETRCLEERLLALKTSNESGIPVFVPVCREDGSYVDVQCHYGTGYCWCVNQVSSGSGMTRGLTG
jgi:hypothetical protein